MNLGNQLSLSQKQQLKLSPQLIQSFELMTLPLQELQQRIQTEIETNPALEIPQASDISFESIAPQGHDDYADDFSDSSSYGSDRYETYSYQTREASENTYYDNEASDRQHQFLENALAGGETLQEHLSGQLGCLKITEAERKIGELIISNLDDNGFHRKNPETLVQKEHIPMVQKLVAIIQGFDPPGICTQDFRESLIVQATLDGMNPEDLKIFSELVYNYLELMRSNKTKEVAKALDISLEDLDTFYAYLKTLTPYPGQNYGNDPDNFAIPDLMIHQVNGQLELNMNNHALPDLKIDPEFIELSDSIKDSKSKEAKETNQYIQKSIKNASLFISQIQLRNVTLYKVGLALIKFQSDFFLNGPRFLKPLTLKMVADEVDMHETTISRISQSKWIETDWGVFSIKHLFSNAVATSGEQDMSKQAVKEVIKEIIESHEGPKALSDQKIADLLAQRGITVARRTVAKYRGELNIDASFIRGV